MITIAKIISLILLVGMATMYPASVYSGQPLYCGDVYRDDLDFVALPVDSDFECGDTILVRFDDGTRIIAPVLDVGPFGHLSVFVDNEYVPIRVDIPEHLWPFDGEISHRASVLNISLLNRMLTDSQVGYLR